MRYSGGYGLSASMSGLGKSAFTSRGSVDPFANHPLTLMTPGTWYEYTGATLSTLSPDPAVSLDSPIESGEWDAMRGGTGFAGIFAFSGGVYSRSANALYVNGGGHTDYYGNEWYRFNVALMQWERVNWPDVDASYTTADGYADDTSRPSAYHTYNGLSYSETSNVFLRAGGSPTGNPTGLYDGAAWTFNQSANTYAELTAQSGGNSFVYAGTLCTCWDSVNNRFWNATQGGLWSREPGSPGTPTLRLDWYTTPPYFDATSSHYNTLVHDIAGGRLLALGSSKPMIFDISTPNSHSVVSQTQSWTGAGAALATTNCVGLDYDVANDEVIAWNGGTAVYVVDATNLTITADTLSGSNAVTPSAAHPQGTYGRFRYIGQWGGKSCFIAVNSVSGSVYFFKRA